MPLSITLTDIRVDNILLDYANQLVTVSYSVLDASGYTWKQENALFWATLPPQTPIYDEDGVTVIGYEPYPPTWYLLPSTYLTQLLGLKAAADAAITQRILGA